MRPLVYANAALLFAVVVHGVDHFRQERGVDALQTGVIVGGTVVWILVALSLWFALREPDPAPAVSLGVGLWVAVGVTLSHFVPANWAPISDPYEGLGLDAFSWFAAALEVGAAAALAA